MSAGKLIPVRIGDVDVYVETSRWLRAHLDPRPPASKEGEGVENRVGFYFDQDWCHCCRASCRWPPAVSTPA